MKTIAAVAKWNIEEAGVRLSETWETFCKKQPAGLKLVAKYRDLLDESRRCSGGAPELKARSIAPSLEARKAAWRILKEGVIPREFALPLCAEASMFVASGCFYASQYARANEQLRLASDDLARARHRDDPYKGLWDKEITLEQWKLLLLTTEAAESTSAFDQLVTLSENDDLAKAINGGLTRGDGHSSQFALPLSRWLHEKLSEWDVDQARVDEIRVGLIEADRCEYLRSCAKYLANRAFADVLLCARFSDPEIAFRCIETYETAAAAITEAYCNAGASTYSVDRKIVDAYVESNFENTGKQGGVYHPEVQRSLARNLSYRAALRILRGETPKHEQCLLNQLYAKDSEWQFPVDHVANTVRTARANLKTIRLEELWPGVLAGLEPGFRRCLEQPT